MPIEPPPPPGFTLRPAAWGDEPIVAALGIAQDRRMRIDLDAGADAPPEPAWPDGLSIDRYDRERDERHAYRLSETAFETVPGYEPQSFEAWRVTWGRPARIDPDLTTVVFDREGDLGAGSVGLDVNAANDNARRLYESAGMRVEWHSDRWTRQLG